MSQTVTARYDYTDASGKRLATKLRLGPVKDFRWVALKDGKEVNGLGGMSQSDLPFYNAAALAKAAPSAFVYLTEGEKDTDNLTTLGVVAVTSPEGAGATKLPRERFEALRGRHVVLLPDNDKPGREYMERVAELLRGVAASVRTLHLPGLGEKEDVSDWIARGGTAEELNRLADDHGPDIWTAAPRSGADLAGDIFKAIKRYVVISDEAARALTLWVLHTHCFEAAQFTPYIQITSPTRESGKTTLIDVLEALVPQNPLPVRADSSTAAAIYRAVDKGRGVGRPSGPPPVLFLDELDAVFGSGGGKSDKAEAIRGVLNSGFRSTGKTLVCDGDANEPRAFVTFCPKVLAAIGACIPDTVTSRAIPIPLSRATRDELRGLQQARAKTLTALTDSLGVEVAAWAQAALPNLKKRDEPILGLKARVDDVWGPLLSIADEIGGDWPVLARDSARVLHADRGDSTDGRDPGIALLSDLRDLFGAEGVAFLPSQRLAELLRSLEGRMWAEYRNGQPITVNGIAKLLRPFGVQPVQERIGYEKVRAYFRSDCEEAFRRYLPSPHEVTEAVEANPGFSSENSCPGYSSGNRGVAASAASTASASADGIPFSLDPDPEGLQPLPF